MDKPDARTTLLTAIVTGAGRDWELTRYEAQTGSIIIDFPQAPHVLAAVAAHGATVTAENRSCLVLSNHGGRIVVDLAPGLDGYAHAVAAVALTREDTKALSTADWVRLGGVAHVAHLVARQAELLLHADVPFGQPLPGDPATGTLAGLLADKAREDDATPTVRSLALALTHHPDLTVTARLLAGRRAITRRPGITTDAAVHARP